MGEQREQQSVSVPFRGRSEWLAFGGAVALVVGSFMTWVVVGPFRAPGTDGDGWFTIAAGVAAAVLAWRARWGAAAVAAGLGLLVVMWKFADIGSAEEVIEVTAGGGLYLCLVGGVVSTWQSVLRWWDVRSISQG